MNLDIDLAGLVLPERIEIADVSEDGHSADFVMDPLERGFGHTLGNSVRRVLLSSLRGSAIWAFRISGVVHEHQTIPSVVEDVHQVIQNLKSLILSLDDDVHEAVLEIRANKAGPVTAAKIRGPGSVTIHNPNHHILTLEDDLEISLELYVNKGRGFVLADQHEVPSDAAVDQVRIDAIYNPVLRASFTVEETRVGQRTDFDRLTIHVETNGSVDPESAVKYAAQLVQKHLEYMLYFSEGGLPVVESTEPDPIPEKLAALPRDLDRRPRGAQRQVSQLAAEGIHQDAERSDQPDGGRNAGDRQLRPEVAERDLRIPGNPRPSLRNEDGAAPGRPPLLRRGGGAHRRGRVGRKGDDRMRHRKKGRNLSRSPSHRRATLRNMATSLFRHERITTTTARAKELRPYAERLVTLARRGDLHARRQVARRIADREVLGKLFDDIGPRYAERPGGYTRILKLGTRKGDAADMALIELV